MRARFVGEDPERAAYWLECPECEARLIVSHFAVELPAFDVGEAKPEVRCHSCGARPHVPGPRDRAIDLGRPDPGPREPLGHALVRSLADQERRRRRGERLPPLPGLRDL